MLKLRCLHCGSTSTWFEMHGRDLVQRCLCGLFRFLRQDVNGVTIMRSAVSQEEVKLPAQGTKIYRCLLALATRWPKTAVTAEIANMSSLHGKETAALLVVLCARGLVERLEERRGMVGGSVWRLTHMAADRLKLERSDQ